MLLVVSEKELTIRNLKGIAIIYYQMPSMFTWFNLLYERREYNSAYIETSRCFLLAYNIYAISYFAKLISRPTYL